MVHDSLCGTGGAEKVFESICKAFPEADIFTLAYNPRRTSSYFRTRRIYISLLNALCQDMESVRWAYLLSPIAMGLFNLSSYDLILSSSTTVGKHAYAPKVPHVCYCYYPPRAIWFPAGYFQGSWKHIFLRPFIDYLRRQDYKAASRVSYFITQSPLSKKMILDIYNRDAPIYPGPSALVDLSIKSPAPPLQERTGSFLLVSRLEPWKRVDYVIEAFNQRSDLALDVVGTGSEMKRLKEKSCANNIRFLGWQSEEQLVALYRNAKALIFPPDLEYGLVPIEANASGLPVIAFDSEGARFTQKVYTHGSLSEQCTSVHYSQQSCSSLLQALETFEALHFCADYIQRHSFKYSESFFHRSLRAYIANLMQT